MSQDHGDASEKKTIDALLDHIHDGDGSPGAGETELPRLDEAAGTAAGGSDRAVAKGGVRADVLRNVRLPVKVELGRIRMPLRDALALGEGALVELEKGAGEPVDILVSGVPIARGRVSVVDGRFCVRVSEVLRAGGAEEA